jgi:hypothetical protein
VIAATVLAVAVTLAAACGDDDTITTGTSVTADQSTVPTTSSTTTTTASTTTLPPVTVEQALGAFDFGGLPYAGDCASATLEEDQGAWCSTLSEDRGTTRIYGAGPTFSEYVTWLLLGEGPAGWVVQDSASTGTMDAPQPAPW